MFDEKTKELIAIGASITANCHPCLDYHVTKARELGIGSDEISQAIEVGKQVRRGASAKTDRLAAEHAGGQTAPTSPAGCGCR